MTATPLLVGIDIGTTACKAAVVSLDGKERSHARVAMPWTATPTGGQLDAATLVEVALRAASRALDTTPDGPVVAVGVTSMAETGVLLDGAGKSVAPAIVWHDSRGTDEVGHLRREVGDARFRAVTGLPLDALCSAAKYLWLRRHHAGSERGRRWLNVAEWVVHRLGGDQVSERSLASRTGWLRLADASPWVEGLQSCGAPPGLLADVVGAAAPAGSVTFGPPRLRGAVLTVGGHDHLCGAVGAGATRPGDVYDSCGTAEALVAAVSPPVERHTVAAAVEGGVTIGWHVLGDRHALLAGLRAGAAYDRVLRALGIDEVAGTALDRAAGAGDVTWPEARQWRDALEHVAGCARNRLNIIEAIAGETTRLVVAGGWTHSAALLTVKRQRLGAFERPPVTEAGARGAALLAAVAAGHHATIEELPSP